jgi:hypothetical protein
MMKEKVREYPDLVKMDRAYVVNSNDSEYHKALARIRNAKKLEGMDARLASLEDKMSSILDLLQRKLA